MKKNGFLLLLLIACLPVFAGVNIRTGNFYIGYTDLEFPGSRTSISRNYNSFSTSTGLFGFGWGSVMETRLFAFPDGSLSVSWWGSGGSDIFEPAVTDRQGLYQMINAIVADELKREKLENNPAAILNRKAELSADANLRIRAYSYLVLDKKVQPWKQVPGRKLSWKRNVNQVISWDGKAYTLSNWRDRYQFNEQGLVITISETDLQLELQYRDGHISFIRADQRFGCEVSTDSTGKITRMAITDSSGKKEALFTYDRENNLVYSLDAGGNEYRYSYDKAHNMTRISYSDQRTMEISYDPVNNRTIRIKERDGTVYTYQYPYFYTREGKIDYLHYATRIQRTDSAGKKVFNEYYEFESRTKENGEDYLYRRLVQTDTSYDEALYDAEVGNAFYRKHNNREAWAKYDNKSRCSYLRINDKVYLSVYDKLDRPSYFIQIDSVKKDSTRFRYEYNEKGQLAKAYRNDSLYTITGSKEQGLITIACNGITLQVYFKADTVYRISNSLYGSLDIEKDTESSGNDIRLKPGVSPGKNKETLLQYYSLFREMTEAKIIRHEWIWERI